MRQGRREQRKRCSASRMAARAGLVTAVSHRNWRIELEKSVEIALRSIIANVANHVDSERFLSSLAKSFEKDAKAQADSDHPVEASELAKLEQAVKDMIVAKHG